MLVESDASLLIAYAVVSSSGSGEDAGVVLAEESVSDMDELMVEMDEDVLERLVRGKGPEKEGERGVCFMAGILRFC